ncbi:MAG: CoA transferase, partial [Dehalococcoidia bacterium]|nr:CoA transferase [Dehalococcoidia bacterium]
EIAYRLVKKADVFYTNFRRGAADRLGVDYQSLSRYNSRLIYARASTYGPKGAEVDTRGFDWVGQARSGMMMAGAGDGDPPFVMTGGMVDQAGAIALAYGVLVALVARDRLGVGQEVDTSLIGSALWLQYISLTSYLLRGKEMHRHDRTRAVNPLGNTYRCADGKWLALIEIQTDRFWGDFCRALGAENLTEDPRFGDVKGRRQHKEALIVILDQIFATKTRDDWVKVLRNYQFAYAPISTIPEMVSDPQVLANDYIVEMDHPDLGRIKAVGLPITLSHSQGMVKNPAPQLGQHTEEVLLDWGGYTWEEISSFREEGVI